MVAALSFEIYSASRSARAVAGRSAIGSPDGSSKNPASAAAFGLLRLEALYRERIVMQALERDPDRQQGAC